MPKIKLTNGTIVDVPDGLSEEETYNLLKQADPDAFDIGLGDKLIEGAKNIAKEPIKMLGTMAGATKAGMEMLASAYPEQFPEDKLRPQENPLFIGLAQFQEGANRLAEDLIPASIDAEVHNSFPAQVGSGLGQVVGMLGLRAINPALGVLAGQAMTIDESYQDAIRNSATPEQQRRAVALASLNGLTEFLPIERALSRFGKPIKNRLIRTFVEGGIGAFEEGLQETVQQLVQNYGAQSLIGYDPDRSLLRDLENSAAVGGATGFLANALITALTGKKVRSKDTITDIPPDQPDSNGQTTVVSPDEGKDAAPADFIETEEEEEAPDWDDVTDVTGPGWDAARAAAEAEVATQKAEAETAKTVAPEVEVETTPKVSAEATTPVSTKAPQTTAPETSKTQVTETTTETNPMEEPVVVPLKDNNIIELTVQDFESAKEDGQVVVFGGKTFKIPKVIRLESGETISDHFRNSITRFVELRKNAAKLSDKEDSDLLDVPENYTETVMGILNARAASANETLDQYLLRRGLGFSANTTKNVDFISKGAAQFSYTDIADETLRIFRVFRDGNAESIIHEIGHLFAFDLYGDDLATINKWLGYDPNTSIDRWHKNEVGKGHEKFAGGFEYYLRTNKAPKGRKELIPIFERAKAWLRNLYSILSSSHMPKALPKDVKKVFDKLLTPGALPTQFKDYELTYSAWKIRYGEDIAARLGISNRSYKISRKGITQRFLNNITTNYLYQKKVEAASQIQIMNTTPNFFTHPALNAEERFYRLLMFSAANINLAFHEKTFNLDEANKIVQKLYEYAGKDSDMRQRVDSLSRYVNDIVRYQEIIEAADTPIKQYLQQIRKDVYTKYKQDILYDRKSGKIYRVQKTNKFGALLIDLNNTHFRRVQRAAVNTNYVHPDIIRNDTDVTFSKEEFLQNMHQKVLYNAIENGYKVPSYAIEPYVDVDPYFKHAYDKALGLEEDKLKVIKGVTLAEDYYEETGIISKLQKYESLNLANVKVDGKLRKKQLEIIKTAVDNSYQFLGNFTNALQKRTRIKFLDIISKTELQHLTNIRGDVGQNTAADYLAEIYKELDAIKESVESGEFFNDSEKVGVKLERLNTIYDTLRKWQERFVESGYEKLLTPEPMESQFETLWAWADKNLPYLPKIVKSLRFGLSTMHWISRRFPMAMPLYRAGSIERLQQATAITNKILNGMAEEEVFTYTDKDGHQQTVRIQLPGIQTFINIPKNGNVYKVIQHIILEGDRQQHRYTDEEIRLIISELNNNPAFELTEKITPFEEDRIIKAYNEVQNTLEWMYYKLQDVLFAQFGSVKGQQIMKRLYPKGHIPGYFPHVRTGKYAVVVKNKEGKTIYFQMYDRIVDKNAGLKRLKDKYPDDIVVEVDPTERIEYQYGGGVDLISAISDVIAKADLYSTTEDPDLARQVEAALEEATAALIKSHGMFSPFQERENIPGYDERVIHVMLKRVHDYAAALAKVNFAKTGAQELVKLRSNPRVYNYAQAWYGAMLQTADQVDMTTAKIRQLIFLKYLGFNVKTAFVVFADKITNAPVRLGLYTKNAEKKLIKSMGETVKFMKWYRQVTKLANEKGIIRDEAAKLVPIPEGFDEETINAMIWSLDSGTSTAKFVPELLSHEEISWEQTPEDRSTKFGRYMDFASYGINKAFDWSSAMLVHVETFNRLSTFHSAWNIFRKEKRMNFDMAMKNAEDLVNDAHFLYGKPNLPNLFTRKGLGKWARTFYVFRAYEHNYVQMLADLMVGRGKEGKILAVKSLTYLMALGGVPALPFFMAFAKVLGAISGDDPEQEILRSLQKLEAPEFVGTMVSDGLPGLMGVTFRGSLQVGAYQNLDELLFGVAGSTARDVYQGTVAISHGDFDTFMRKILPTVIANPYKAVQGKRHGVLSTYGTPLRENLYGAQIKYTDGEFLAKLLSFNPSREAKAYRLKHVQLVEKEYWNSRRQNILTKFKKGIRTSDRAYLMAAIQDIIDYERDLAEKGAIEQPHITRTTLRNSLLEVGLRRREVLQILRLTGQLHGK